MEKTYQVKGMTCVICKNNVEKALNKTKGVNSAIVNLIENEVYVNYDENIVNDETLLKSVKDAGYTLITNEKMNVDKTLINLVVSISLLLILMYFSMLRMHEVEKNKYIQLVLCTFILLLQKNHYNSGIRSLMKLSPNMDSLVSISSLVSYFYSIYSMFKISSMNMDYHLYFETAAMIPVIVSIGKFIEGRTKSQTMKTIRGLSTLIPMQANLIDKDGHITIIPIDDLKKNNMVLVKPGESIPRDGIIISGSSSIDESMITGESLPRFKTINDEVIGGTINTTGTLQIKVTKSANMSVLSNIINLTKKSSMEKIHIERIADSISKYFVFAVMSLSLITFVIWLIFKRDIELSLNFALSVLVISCPCALGLATPSAIGASLGVSAKNGILIKKPEILEYFYKTKNIVLDKTGTLTQNSLAIVEEIKLDNEFEKVLVTLEKSSNHPISKTILAHYKIEENIVLKSNEFIPGEGIIGEDENNTYLVGNKILMDKNNITIPDEYLKKSEESSYSYIAVAKNKTLLGLIYLSDILRDTSYIAIKNLKKRHINPIMCTGDNVIVAKKVSKILEIKDFLANVKPEDKMEVVKEKKNDGIVAMVGDGVNDAVALSFADVSISIKNASDIAYASSDVILMKNDLNDISFLYDLSVKTMRIIKQNLFWALFYNAIFIPVAAGLLYPINGFKLNPMIGAGTMALSSIFVVTNALRINKLKKEEIKLMNKTVLIEGMMCNNCRKHAEDALKALGLDVEVSLEDKKAYIKNTAIDNQKIIEAIENCGYEVKEIIDER